MRARRVEIFLGLTLMLLGGLTLRLTAAEAADAGGTIVESHCASPTLGHDLAFLVYLPAGYETSPPRRYPTLYLLHGRGDTMHTWLEAKSVLDALIAERKIPPLIAVMPDAPSSRRAGYYIDSQFAGSAVLPPGEAVETAFTRDLIAHVDHTWRTLPIREKRFVAGYSMGGYGAIRFAFAHPALFAGAVALSPAVYDPLPPAASSARDFGAFGVGAVRFDEARYRALAGTWLAARPERALLRVFIAVGDDEPVRDEVGSSLTSDAVQFHRRCRAQAGVDAQLRVLNGGHEWRVWRAGLAAALEWLAGENAP